MLLVLDGAYFVGTEPPVFRRVAPLGEGDLQALVERLAERIRGALERRDVLVRDTDSSFLETPQVERADALQVRREVPVKPIRRRAQPEALTGRSSSGSRRSRKSTRVTAARPCTNRQKSDVPLSVSK